MNESKPSREDMHCKCDAEEQNFELTSCIRWCIFPAVHFASHRTLPPQIESIFLFNASQLDVVVYGRLEE